MLKMTKIIVRNIINRKLAFRTFTLIYLMLFIFDIPACYSSQTSIYVAPPTITATVGQTFVISINVSEVVGLYGWEFKLKWNSTVLDALNVTEGEFLKSSHDTFFQPIINNTLGCILVDCTLLGDIPGVNGSGILTLVEFRVERVGESILDLYDTKLVNSDVESIPHQSMDGYFQSLGKWETAFIDSGRYPIIDFAIYHQELYATSGDNLYVYNGNIWTAINAPIYVLSLEPYEDKLILGGKGGLYSYNGTNFTLIFPVSNYIKPLGVYNNTLYAGTVLDNTPTLHYCNGSAENPDSWYTDTDFSTTLNFSGPFGSIDSFAVYNNNMYVTSGARVCSYNGTDWSIAETHSDVYAFLGTKVYNSKLYLATRDASSRCPLYEGGSGFCGRVIEFDGANWETIFDHDYWIFSLETYNGKLYAGTANKIFTYNGTHWETSFRSEEGAYYAISLMTYDGRIYAGMGNGYIFTDPSCKTINAETIVIPEFPSTIVLLLTLVFAVSAVVMGRTSKNTRERSNCQTNMGLLSPYLVGFLFTLQPTTFSSMHVFEGIVAQCRVPLRVKGSIASAS